MRQLLDDSNRKATGLLFGQALDVCLVKKYGRAPSVTKFADLFNLRAHGTTTISRETARKWLRGLVIPEMGRLKVLINWLDLKPADFLYNSTASNSHNPTTEPANKSVGVVDNKINVANLFGGLNDKSIDIMVLMAWALREIQNNPERKMDLRKLGIVLENE